ncbi:MAG: hypothetical protein ABSF95_20005 [Verrucomicrobiota bacterium]|jgi:hypothetical protein
MFGIPGARDEGRSTPPAVILGLLVGAFIMLQCFLPLGTAIRIGVDEDFELSKATLCRHGYKLYTQIWSDQPPLYVSLLAGIQQHVSPGILGPRLLTSALTLLLLSSFFVLVLRASGLLAASLATGLLIASPGFLELSSSAMQELPALAPAVAALCVLLGPHGQSRVAELLGGALFAVALQMKLTGLVYLPLAVLILWLRSGEAAGVVRSGAARLRQPRSGSQARGALSRWQPAATGLAVFAAALALGFVALNWLTGNPLLIQLQQAWGAHFAGAKSFEYGSPAEHAFDWSVLLKNWDATLPALVGVAFLLRSIRQVRVATLPVAWLALTLVVFGTHKPWWAYYYVHNALPLCWCAGVGIGLALRRLSARRSSGLAVLLGLYALCALAWMGARLYLQESGIRQAPKLYSCLVLKEIERFKPFTTFIYSDQPIYSFHSGIPVPPRLAILSLKRFWTGDLTTARLVAELESVKPGLMLLANDSREVPFQALLNREYQLVYQEEAIRLYAHRGIAKKARY